MYAVIFEVKPKKTGKDAYLKLAAGLRGFLQNRAGFISIERFQSLVDDDKILSLSFWENETAIKNWRNLLEHRSAQKKGKESLFHSYRIRVAQVTRDYSIYDRHEAPSDSNDIFSNKT